METLRFLFTSTFYPPHHIGGDAVHVKYLAEELTKRGHEVHVFYSLDAYDLKRRKMVDKIERCGVNTHYVLTPMNSSAYCTYVLGNSPVVTKKFNELIEHLNPDVVHHHNISLLGYNILKKRKDYLNLYTAHDYWLICPTSGLMKHGGEICENGSCFVCSLRCRRPPQLWRKVTPFKAALREIDLLIAPSNYLKNRLIQKLRVNAVTIPNFVPEPPSSISSSGFSNFFLYAGVLEKHKGIMSLFDVFKQGKLGSKLLIVGRGSLEHQIATSVKKYELGDKIVLLGWVSKEFLYSLLSDATALIMPSIWPENSPLIALEAISVGTPVLSSNKGGLPEIAAKIDERLIFSHPPELASLLQGFSKSQFSKTKIKAVYEQNFAPNAYVGKYLTIIRTL